MPCTPSDGVCLSSCHSGEPASMWSFELRFRKAIVVAENKMFEECQMETGDAGGTSMSEWSR